MKVNSIYNASIACAREAKNAIDQRFVQYNPNEVREKYGAFLKSKAQCPTRAKIAMQEVVTRDGIKHPDFYLFYQEVVEARRDMKQYVDKINAKEELQEKTLPYRDYLISNNMIKMDTVTPKKSKYEKLMYRIKQFFN